MIVLVSTLVYDNQSVSLQTPGESIVDHFLQRVFQTANERQWIVIFRFKRIFAGFKNGGIIYPSFHVLGQVPCVQMLLYTLNSVHFATSDKFFSFSMLCGMWYVIWSYCGISSSFYSGIKFPHRKRLVGYRIYYLHCEVSCSSSAFLLVNSSQ